MDGGTGDVTNGEHIFGGEGRAGLFQTGLDVIQLFSNSRHFLSPLVLG
jgi:hypothetical protein